jgi:tripartite-type tricarboxylate transporter receptor subunit TctC
MCNAKIWTKTFKTIIVALALVSSVTASFAQVWPKRMVRVIVPVPPGSSPDIAARLFAEQLAKRWNHPVIVENRPGADGLIGASEFAAADDDHALFFSFAAPLTVYPITKDKLSYDPNRDLVPISTVAETFGAISVPASLPVRTISELIAYARSHPGQLNWASGGGAFPIIFAGFLKSENLDVTEVPYRNQNQALQDTAEGRLQIMITPMTPMLPFVQAGKLRVLAVTNKVRAPLWPDVPTATEGGYPALGFDGLLGVFGPRDTPRDRLERIAADINTVASQADVASRLAALGQVVQASTPAEFSAAIDEQRVRISSIVRLIGRSNR